MKILLLIYTTFLPFNFALSFSTTSNLKLDTIFKTNDVVWSFAFISKEELVITLRGGLLIHYNIKKNIKKNMSTPNVEVKGQGGLLDVHYRLVDNKKFIYMTYSERIKETVTTSLARAILKDKTLINLKTIFRSKIKSNTNRHFGSRIVFRENYIFMTVGERGERNHSQDLSLHNGKILRLTLDGKPAKGNPFENQIGALPEIWSYGHRNPQGIDIDPVSNQIFSCEFGPRGGDELNLIEKGRNYGWPIITYGKEYWGPKIGQTHKKGMVQPIAYWVPSISPSGMVFYLGDKIKKWKNNLFLANLSSTHLRRLILKNDQVIFQEELFKNLNERIRHVRNGPDGYLYFSTDSGKIIKVSNEN